MNHEDEVRELMSRIESVVRKEALPEWLAKPNPAFGGKSPNELIESRRLHPLWTMLYRVESGEPS